MKRTGPQNPELKQLIRTLKKLSNKENVKIWKRIASDLSCPTRNRRKVNIYKIDKYTNEGETAIIPGKVLSVGTLNKNILIAAYQFSEAAKEKLRDNTITIEELTKKNPKGKKLRIIG